jgi:hypothetical protein
MESGINKCVFSLTKLPQCNKIQALCRLPFKIIQLQDERNRKKKSDP